MSPQSMRAEPRAFFVTVALLLLVFSVMSVRPGAVAERALAAPNVYAIPPSIPGDCSRDVAQQITDWIASVPDNATLVFGQKACYKTERVITVTNKAGLVIDGNGATFKRFEVSPAELQWPRANQHFLFVGARNIAMRNLRIEGTNTAPDQRRDFGSYQRAFEFEHGLALQGVQGVVVEDVFIEAVWGDGIYLGAQRGGGPTTNARISRATIDRNGRQGIALSGVNGVLIEDCKILHSRRSGIDLEPPPGTVENVEIRTTTINSHLIPFSAYGGHQVSNIFIHNNVIEGEGKGMWLFMRAADNTRRHDWRVYDNKLVGKVGTPLAAMLFVNVDNVDIRRNISHISTAQSRKAVEFRNAGGQLFVIENDFTGACAPYVADGATGLVVASGNIVSADCAPR